MTGDSIISKIIFFEIRDWYEGDFLYYRSFSRQSDRLTGEIAYKEGCRK